MTEDELAYLDGYVRSAADVMGLRDWTIEVGREPCDENKRATVDFTFGKRWASIRFAEDFRDYDLEQQRRTVAHELIHCHLDALEDCLRDELYSLGRLNDGELAAIRRSHLRAEELAVHALSRVVDRLLPLPEWPDAA